jgi:hypothetical protein
MAGSLVLTRTIEVETELTCAQGSVVAYIKGVKDGTKVLRSQTWNA